jgi:sulfoxide reductase catalytic subunit YedY
MSRRHKYELPEHAVTPESVFLDRRAFLKGAARSAALAAAAGTLAPARANARTEGAELPAPELYPAARNAELSVDLPLTPEELAATYNNFYEFGGTKQIAERAQGLTVRPWPVEIGGCAKAGSYEAEVLIRRFALEERIYRFRCVEAWAMVVPWTGFPLADLVRWAEPDPTARFVRFETFHRRSEAIGQVLSFWYPWPYTEGLRLDEATNELAMIVTGAYGKPLPKQHGAPLRLIVPWKYGFKSIKSIVKIDFVAEQPSTFWNTAQPEEYGFLANVNPDVPHPRWSQATERLLGSEEKQPTLFLNGYERWVGHLYPEEPRG